MFNSLAVINAIGDPSNALSGPYKILQPFCNCQFVKSLKGCAAAASSMGLAFSKLHRKVKLKWNLLCSCLLHHVFVITKTPGSKFD